jgi:hypothetical protein
VKKRLWTSNFASLRRLPKDYLPVSISRGRPKWYHGRGLDCLAPTWQMLRMSKVEYDRHYMQLLGGLDPQAVVDRLADNSVLLCWEQPGISCHRRLVAEWLEQGTKLVIPEWGYHRDATMKYEDMPSNEDDVLAPQRLLF